MYFLLTKGIAGLIVVLAGVLFYFISSPSDYQCAHVDPEWPFYQGIVQLLCLLYIVCAILVGAHFKGRIKEWVVLVTLMGSIAFVFWIKIIPKQVECYPIDGALAYDILVENTGNSASFQPYFCTPQCPCHLPESPYLYTCNEIIRDNRTIVNRNIYECGNSPCTNDPQLYTRITDCKGRFRKFKNYDLMYCLEQVYSCSGWCLNCNLQTLFDSLNVNLDSNFEESRSCAKVRDDHMTPVKNRVFNLVGGEIVVILLALVIDCFKYFCQRREQAT